MWNSESRSCVDVPADHCLLSNFEDKYSSNTWDGNMSQNHRAESVYLLCKRGPQCRNTEKSNQSPISIKGGNSPRQPTKGSAFYIKLSEVAPPSPPPVQKHLTKFSLIFSCSAFQNEGYWLQYLDQIGAHNNRLQFSIQIMKPRFSDLTFALRAFIIRSELNS